MTPHDLQLPPWGLMDNDLLSDIKHRHIPPDWTPPQGGAPNAQNWSDWLKTVIDPISRLLWPIYKPGSADWNTDHVRDLITADFELLGELQPYLDTPIRAAYPTTVTHGDFYTQEDDTNIRLGTGYERYDPELPRSIRKTLLEGVHAGIVNKVTSLDLQLKQAFLRPRAYQVALLQGRVTFRHQAAQSANTPSMISGHCLDGSMSGTTAFHTAGDQLGALSLEILKQFTVDIGDRRVFAGLHYPSDNLSSWYTALRLIPRVFDPADEAALRQFLWSAIDTRSVVFHAIKRHIAQNPHSPYDSIASELSKLGTP